MDAMRRALLIVGFVFSSAAAAQHSHGGMQPSPRGNSASVERRVLTEQPLFFDGEVRAVDKSAAMVTLKHDSISIFGLSATTAAYAVRDAAVLDQVRPGDKVRFTAVLQGRLFIITKIVPAN